MVATYLLPVAASDSQLCVGTQRFPCGSLGGEPLDRERGHSFNCECVISHGPCPSLSTYVLLSVSGSNKNIAFLRKLEDERKNHISEACKSFILGQTFQHAI